MKGFSTTNLKYMVRWYQFYSQELIIGQQAAAHFQKGDEGDQGDEFIELNKPDCLKLIRVVQVGILLLFLK